jgi:hypothetical protein
MLVERWGKRRVDFFVLCIVIFSMQVLSQAQEQYGKDAHHRLPSQQDTTHRTVDSVDSLNRHIVTHDTTRHAKSILVKPVAEAGSIIHEPSYAISDSEIRWSDYTYSGKVLQKIPGSFLADMAQPGDPSELYFDGLGAGYSKYLLDGVELNEPTMSSFNLYHVPMEFVSHVQYIDPLRAPIYQFNATGGLVNFQTPSYNEAVPYSKVRHMEEPYNYLITDGVFSQNIGFRSNVDLGFERQTTDQRFLNSLYDGVNIRAKYRYSIDSTQQFTLTELYYRTKGGINGGSLPYNVSTLIFDQGFAPLRSYHADLTYLQHHLRVAYSRSDPHDSTEFLTVSAFFDYFKFQFGDVSIPYYLTNISRRVGASLRGSYTPFGSRLNFGAEAVQEQNPYNSSSAIPSSNRVSGYADEEFYLLDLFKVGMFGRADLDNNKFYSAFGGTAGIGSGVFTVRVGANLSHHVPSMSQKYFLSPDFVGNSNLSSETDRLFEVLAGVKISNKFKLSLKTYERDIDHPIYYLTKYNGEPDYPQISVVNLSSRKILGLDATMELNVWKFGAKGNLNYVDEKVDGGEVYTLPKVFAIGELYFHDVLFTGHLNLKVGIRGQLETSFKGEEFYPAALVYYPAFINTFGPFGSSDFFLQGKVGDAVIYFTLFNLTNQEYLLAPVYPALGTSFGFGINWEFLN